MDKRTLLAFALIFLVYIGWMQLYERMYGGRAPARPDTTAAALVPADTDTDAAASWSAAPAEVAAAPQTAPGSAEEMLAFLEPASAQPPLRVGGPLYDLVIDPNGGRIASWRGRSFKGQNPDEPVELVPPDGPGSDEIRFSRATLSLADAPFAIEGPANLEVPADGPARAVLVAETAGGLLVRKIFTFRPGEYGIDLRLELEMAPGAPDPAGTLGDPLTWRFVWDQGIASTEDERSEKGTFRGFARVGDEMVVRRQQDLGHPEKGGATLAGSLRFAGIQNRYFTIAGSVADSAVVEGRAILGGDAPSGRQSWALEQPLRRQAQGPALAAQELHLYLGPSQYDLLKAHGQGLELSLDLGWKLFRPLSELILTVMTHLYRLVPNYGVVIILVSLLINLIFYPLTRSQRRSMKRMQEIQPKIKALQEKYRDNREKLSQKMMEMYKKEKVNPAAGCLPLLVQMPVFIALYQVLSKTVALRQAPFVLWIDDLGRPDALFQLPFSLPLLGDSFNLLPLVMAAATYVQTALSPAPAGGGQMAMMTKIMPFMMLFFFYNFPSGLVLYWLVNTIVTAYQAWRIQKTAPVAGGAPIP